MSYACREGQHLCVYRVTGIKNKSLEFNRQNLADDRLVIQRFRDRTALTFSLLGNFFPSFPCYRRNLLHWLRRRSYRTGCMNNVYGEYQIIPQALIDALPYLCFEILCRRGILPGRRVVKRLVNHSIESSWTVLCPIGISRQLNWS